jgi:hypothetical protein
MMQEMLEAEMTDALGAPKASVPMGALAGYYGRTLVIRASSSCAFREIGTDGLRSSFLSVINDPNERW